MSEIQDSVAVVEMMGHTIAAGGRLGVFLSKGVINLIAAIAAYEKTHKQYKGAMEFLKFQKKFGNEMTLLSFPAELSDEELKEIGSELEKMGIAYSWAPIFTDDPEKPYIMAIRQSDAHTAKVILEHHMPKDMSVQDYVNTFDPDVLERMSKTGIQEMNYQNMHILFSEHGGTINEQLNHRIERDYEHQEPWITFDVDRPENYISQVASKEEGYTITTYHVYRNDRKVAEYVDGPGCDWNGIKRQMVKDMGIDKNYDRLFTFRDSDAMERLKTYQNKSLEAAEKIKKAAPAEKDVDDAVNHIREGIKAVKKEKAATL